MPEPAIAAEELTRRYDDLLAVDRVSFEVAPGEVLGLLGPNGAGKTTLLRMLAGVLAPTAGRARIAGWDVATAPLEAKARLGFLSGDTALYGRLTVREILAYFGRLHGLGAARIEARVREIDGELSIADLLGRRAGELSSGQRQRANLARAFLADPPVLILDEPTATLDVISGGFVHAAIRRARAAGKAVLLSTHIMSEAADLCDRIALLVRGRLAALGTREAILAASGARSLTELLVSLHETAPNEGRPAAAESERAP